MKDKQEIVYVLIKENVMGLTENTPIVRTYRDLEKARSVMEAEYNAKLTEWQYTYGDMCVFEKDDMSAMMSAMIWERFRSNTNNITWRIYAQEVQ